VNQYMVKAWESDDTISVRLTPEMRCTIEHTLFHAVHSVRTTIGAAQLELDHIEDDSMNESSQPRAKIWAFSDLERRIIELANYLGMDGEGVW